MGLRKIDMEALDRHNKEKLESLYPNIKVRFHRVFQDMYRLYGCALRITETERSFSRQKSLYESSKIMDGPRATWARPGESLHHYGLAFDVCFANTKHPYEGLDDMWERYGELSKAHGLEWGGYWKEPKRDRPHCQLTFGMPTIKIMELYKLGGVEAIWSEIDKIRGIPIGNEWKNVISRTRIPDPTRV